VLPGKCKALNSNPSTAKKERRQKERKEKRKKPQENRLKRAKSILS
jgi:hypothetical protein